MTVVSSKEFSSNQTKYFDLALDEQVFVRRETDNIMFVVTRDIQKHKKPDDDFRRAITMDELRRRVKENVHKWYVEKNESNSLT